LSQIKKEEWMQEDGEQVGRGEVWEGKGRKGGGVKMSRMEGSSEQ
jgi:hypothetical protein